jgi:hypothetical protein
MSDMNERPPNAELDGMPAQYAVARVREAFARDGRVATLDIQVRIVGSEVYLTGTVGSNARAAAAEDIARELLPHHHVHNQLTLDTPTTPSGREEIS